MITSAIDCFHRALLKRVLRWTLIAAALGTAGALAVNPRASFGMAAGATTSLLFVSLHRWLFLSIRGQPTTRGLLICWLAWLVKWPALGVPLYFGMKSGLVAGGWFCLGVGLLPGVAVALALRTVVADVWQTAAAARRSAHILALAAMLGLLSVSAAYAAEGHETPGTWLNWLESMRIGGQPLVTTTAGLLLAWALLVALLLTMLSVVASRRLRIRARPWQLMVEAVVQAIHSLLEGPMGDRAREFVPVVGTMMIYIACMNLLGLVPGAISPTASLNTTAALALVSFATIHYVGFRESRLGYLKHFVEGVPLQYSPKVTGILSLLALLPVAAMVAVSHLVTALFLPVTLAFRLYGNIYGEEQVVGSLAQMAAHSHTPWVPIQLPNMLLGLITSVVQAMIFGMLTGVNISLVLRHGSSEDAAHSH